MSETIKDSVLRRKLVPRPAEPMFAFSAPEPQAPGGRLLPRSFIRAASKVADLVVQASVRSSRPTSLAELIEMPEGDGFTALLSDGDGPPGLVIFDPGAFSSVIEAMTIGRLAPKPPASRRATTTDAALMGDLVDAVLAEVDANPDPADDFSAGFRLSGLVEDLRLLDVMLEDVPYALSVLDIDILSNGVGRKGQFTLALPQPAPDLPDLMASDLSFDDAPVFDDSWKDALEASVMAAPTVLGAVLGRVRLPLSEALKLGVDSRLMLPLSQLEEVQLESLDRTTLALGRLGQYRGMRALRLTVLPGTGGDTATDGGGAMPRGIEPEEKGDWTIPEDGMKIGLS